MKCRIIGHQHYSVDLPFTQRVNHHIIDKRHGILVELSCDTHRFQVEISPFPGFSDTPLEQAFDQFQIDVTKVDLPLGLSLSQYIDLFNQYKLTPSSFFAFIQVVDQWMTQNNNEKPLRMNQLMSFDQFRELKQNIDPLTKVKIKIFRQSFDEIIDSLTPFSEKEFKHYFRVDMNGTWRPEQLNELWSALEALGKQDLIDYFEEPLEHYDSYKEINPEIPIMHEENFNQYLKRPDLAQGLVYKPSQVNWPIPIPKRLVISSCWEGPRGLSALKRIAKLFPDEFHGLGACIEYPKKKTL